jgi:hypothetical protein
MSRSIQRPIRVLLQTSIRRADDDWHVGRFSALAGILGEVAEVVARDRQPDRNGDDPVLSSLSRSDFDEVWLLGVDGGEGPSPRDCAAINAFHEQGGGLLTARDHQNMGLWLRQIRGVGAAHFFHASEYGESDPSRLCPDDTETPSISWPNYHSGRNGDFRRIAATGSHPLLERADAPGGRVELFPSHPHEGAVGVPRGEARAHTVARSSSLVTGREFDLIVAFERTDAAPGRAIAESSFHHFADYNLDPSRGAPSFVTEPPGDGILGEPRVMADLRAYLHNAARWLAPAT